jgi:hypothetical protein
MSYLERLGGRQSRRRLAPPQCSLEVLEGRTLLSGTGASAASAHGNVITTTVLTTTLPTAVTGAQSFFTASVQNAANGAPIDTGKVTFEVDSPQKIVLGTAQVSKNGLATLVNDQLTKIGTYQIEALYSPASPKISASQATPISVQVIPQPLHVPTSVSLATAPKAESGQNVPLVAVVNDAGTGNQVDAGKVQPISGTVEIYTKSPRRILLGEVALNESTKVNSPSGLLSAIESAFGQSNQATTKSGNLRASILTNKLTEIGPYQILARFVPSNDDFAASTSSPTFVTISPTTHEAPTVTNLQPAASTIETGESLTLNVLVHNPSSTLAGGVVKFISMAPHPVLLGKVTVAGFDQEVSFTTAKLEQVGDYRIRAVYLPGNTRFARSTSAPVTAAVTPLTAASFRVKPVVSHGQLEQPLSFTVTALDAEGRPLTNYTGTITISSPTDSLPTLPLGVYSTLGIIPPSPATPGLATINPTSYTFTTADQGSHTFVGALKFGKAGLESIQVTQADDPKVSGEAKFSIE